MGQLHSKIAVFTMLLLVGCGESLQTLKPGAAQDPSKKQPLTYYEETLRPSDFDEEVEIVRQALAQSTGSVPLVIPEDSTMVVVEEGQGFRIQIFASSSIDEANAAKVVAEEKALRDSIYIVYDPPVYKVRVGDFVTRYDANQHLTRLINIGYPDAWVVADRITHRRTVRVERNGN